MIPIAPVEFIFSFSLRYKRQISIPDNQCRPCAFPVCQYPEVNMHYTELLAHVGKINYSFSFSVQLILFFFFVVGEIFLFRKSNAICIFLTLIFTCCHCHQNINISILLFICLYEAIKLNYNANTIYHRCGAELRTKAVSISGSQNRNYLQLSDQFFQKKIFLRSSMYLNMYFKRTIYS